MPFNHSAGFSPSPGLGNSCRSVQESTGTCAAPSHTSATILARRLVLQKVGDHLFGQVPPSHLLSHGTSGQFSGLLVTQVEPGTHRSATSNRTRPDGVSVWSDRNPYSIRSSHPSRTYEAPEELMFLP